MEAAKGGRKSFTFGGGNFGGAFVPRKTVDLDIPAGELAASVKLNVM